MMRLDPKPTGWASQQRRPTSRHVWIKKHLMREYGRCAVCGDTKGLELDHIRPVADGGRDEIENCQLLCPRHHAAKTRRDADERRRRAKRRSYAGLIGGRANPEREAEV